MSIQKSHINRNGQTDGQQMLEDIIDQQDAERGNDYEGTCTQAERADNSSETIVRLIMSVQRVLSDISPAAYHSFLQSVVFMLGLKYISLAVMNRAFDRDRAKVAQRTKRKTAIARLLSFFTNVVPQTGLEKSVTDARSFLTEKALAEFVEKKVSQDEEVKAAIIEAGGSLKELEDTLQADNNRKRRWHKQVQSVHQERAVVAAAVSELLAEANSIGWDLERGALYGLPADVYRVVSTTAARVMFGSKNWLGRREELMLEINEHGKNADGWGEFMRINKSDFRELVDALDWEIDTHEEQWNVEALDNMNTRAIDFRDDEEPDVTELEQTIRFAGDDVLTDHRH